MPVSAAHPDAVKLDEAFAAAMNTPGAPREPGPPPEVDKDAPFGRDEAGEALAPFGTRKDGKPRLSAAGRRAQEDEARVGTAPAKPGAPDGGKKPAGAVSAPQGYAPAIAETLEVVWLGGTVLGQVGPEIPVLGRFLPDGDKLQAQAAVVLLYKNNIAGALDLCAQHNEQARRLAEKLSTGSAGWALNAAFMLLPVITTSLKVWGGEERQVDPETQAEIPTLAEQLAAQNRESFQAYMADLAQQAKVAAAMAQMQADAMAGNPNGH
jgi:hypothetical protein